MNPRHEPRRDDAIARIQGVFDANAMTAGEVADALSMSRTTAKRYLQWMRGINGAGIPRTIRIASWERTAGRPLAIYRSGTAPDAPEPDRLTKAQYNTRSRAKKPKAANDPMLAWIPHRSNP